MPHEADLKTPWIRDELLVQLGRLADVAWLAAATSVKGGSDALNEVLDFFDDTGALDEPDERIGYFLHDQSEADAMSALSTILQEVLDMGMDRDWNPVTRAAHEALQAMGSHG